MGLFKKDNENNLYDYLDKEVDRAEIKAICSNAVNEIKFLNLALYIVSTYIASAISTCEFKVYKKKKEVKDTSYYKLNYSPNPNETATKLKYEMVKRLVQTGDSLVVKFNNYLYFAETFGFASESINGYVFDGITIQKTPIKSTFKKKNVFYLKLDDEAVKDLLELVDTKYKELVSCASKAYKRAINNKWKLKIDSAREHSPKFQEEFDSYINDQLKEFLTGDEGVFPELNGYELSHLDDGSDKTDSSDIRNLRKDIFDMVAQAYKMPVSMMYGNVTNLKEVINQFITFAVKPNAKMIGEEITRVFFTEEEILDGSRVEIDVSSINYRDIFDVADKLDKLIYSSVSDIDEARKLINLPELNTEWSKQHWMTKNNGKVEDVMNGVDPSSSNNVNNNKSNNDSTDKALKGGDIDEEQQ